MVSWLLPLAMTLTVENHSNENDTLKRGEVHQTLNDRVGFGSKSLLEGGCKVNLDQLVIK